MEEKSQNEILSTSIMEIIMLKEPKTKDYFEYLHSEKIAKLDYQLSLRINKKEEIEFIKKEFNQSREVLGFEPIYQLLETLKQNPIKFISNFSHMDRFLTQLKVNPKADLFAELANQLTPFPEFKLDTPPSFDDMDIPGTFNAVATIFQDDAILDQFISDGNLDPEKKSRYKALIESTFEYPDEGIDNHQKKIYQLFGVWYEDKYAQYLKERLKAYYPGNDTDGRKEYSFRWVGSKNKTQFVQLIYALHEAGYLTNEENQIGKLVEDLGEVFKVNLGENWQKNHSNAIHRSNSDYEPKVFKILAESYSKYSINLIEEKRTK